MRVKMEEGGGMIKEEAMGGLGG